MISDSCNESDTKKFLDSNREYLTVIQSLGIIIKMIDVLCISLGLGFFKIGDKSRFSWSDDLTGMLENPF